MASKPPVRRDIERTGESDIGSTSLEFVDPNEVDERWRVVLFGAPGVGKTVAACSAPGPIVAVSADRPGAYRYARQHYPDKQINEARFKGSQTLRDVYQHVEAYQDRIGTVILDPFSAMYDVITKENTGPSGKPNWQKINDVCLGVVHSFRKLDVNLVLVAYERREEDESNETETKIFPALGGPSLVSKVMGDMDIVARVYRKDSEEGGEPVWMGQLASARGYQCKESVGGVLGRTRVVDLTEWFEVANAAGRPEPVPFDPVEAVKETFEATEEAA